MISSMSDYYQKVAEVEKQMEKGIIECQRMVNMYEQDISNVWQNLKHDDESGDNNRGDKVSDKLAIDIASSDSE